MCVQGWPSPFTTRGQPATDASIVYTSSGRRDYVYVNIQVACLIDKVVGHYQTSTYSTSYSDMDLVLVKPV